MPSLDGDYTGATTLTGGNTFVNSMANSGSTSSIGASPPAASNLVLAGGKLNYTGPGAVSDRGFTINANDTEIITANNLKGMLTISGSATVTSNGDALVITGTGTLTLSGVMRVKLGY